MNGANSANGVNGASATNGASGANNELQEKVAEVKSKIAQSDGSAVKAAVAVSNGGESGEAAASATNGAELKEVV